MISQRLTALRAKMKENGITWYIIFTNDDHQSEYVGDYFRVREYFSGFTGSAGVLAVGPETAGLWTDGRYYIQAEQQLLGSGITLFKSGTEGVPDTYEYLKATLKEGDTVGFDFRTISAREGCKYAALLKEKNGRLIYIPDMIDDLWPDRPPMSDAPAFLLDTCYSGMSASDKLKKLRATMQDNHADLHLLSSLDDIAWLFNIRGNDVTCNPVVLSYALITPEEAFLYTDSAKFSEAQIKELSGQGISMKSYADIFTDLASLGDGIYLLHDQSASLLLDKNKISYALLQAIPDSVQIIDRPNPEILMKAVKNPTEIKNLKNAHIKDGIAVTKFMRWLKQTVSNKSLTEWEASEYLESLRAEQEGFIELSFTTICAYNANAAMMHYSASETQCAILKPEGILLVDSGGQYYEGTTDITRTFCLGPVSQIIKDHFTLVLKGMLHLQNAHFLQGCSGLNLDILARQPLWDIGLDYRCGTGHGVGYLLNVHEAPNGFRYKIVPERNDSCALEAGMVTTDEPGVYIEGSHGIRIENELLCVEGEHNEYGQFMQFEPLTVVPIDLELVNPDLLSSTDRQQLNNYHKFVYDTIAPHLNAEEQLWLVDATRAI